MTIKRDIAVQTSITAIIPVYLNRNELEQYIRQCLLSVVSQTRPPDEIIIVDDGSPFPAAGFLRQFDFFDQLKILRLEKNSGVSAARNAGLQAASGTWVAYLDHDDAWAPTKLETQLAYLREHPECDGADCLMEATYRDGQTLVWGKDRPVFTLEAALQENQIFNQMLLIKRSALVAVGGFDPEIKVWDDQAICIRLAAAGFRIDHIPESLGLHRRHLYNASGKTAAYIRDGMWLYWKYRALFHRTFGWRSFPARTAYVLENAGRKRGKVLGRILRVLAVCLKWFGDYKPRPLIAQAEQ